jgi:hypothetical protein
LIPPRSAFADQAAAQGKSLRTNAEQ